jgi:hypothetical protein
MGRQRCHPIGLRGRGIKFDRTMGGARRSPDLQTYQVNEFGEIKSV